MVLAEPKTIHNVKDLENKFVTTPSGEPDKSAYRYKMQKTGIAHSSLFSHFKFDLFSVTRRSRSDSVSQ